MSMKEPRRAIVPGMLVAAMAFVAAAVVVGSLRRPEMPTWEPTRGPAVEVGDSVVGPVIHTVDASDAERWAWFDFSRAARVERPGPREWDLAFRRNEIIVNGGELAGEGGAIVLSDVPFDSLTVAPAGEYAGSTAGRDTTSAAFDGWYDYGWTTHLLEPRPITYAVRTADGRYAKLEILGYYCPGARSGCYTFRYLYRGDGERDLTSD